MSCEKDFIPHTTDMSLALSIHLLIECQWKRVLVLYVLNIYVMSKEGHWANDIMRETTIVTKESSVR